MKTSIVVAFYNNYTLLRYILQSLSDQVDNAFDVVIADDGSRRDVVDCIEREKSSFGYSIHHVWQPDQGFRKNRVLNAAVVESSSDYLIFIDGDCVPQRHFVEDHVGSAKPGVCLCGRRVDIRLDLIGDLDMRDPGVAFSRNLGRFLRYGMKRKAKNVEKGLRFDGGLIGNALNRKKRGIVGCNFSLFREDLLSINGFDERYEGPGTGEDSDIEFRLERQGVVLQSLVFKANVVHFDAGSQARNPANAELLAEVMRRGTAWATLGIEKPEDGAWSGQGNPEDRHG